MTDRVWREVRPNGVVVESTVPFKVAEWQDRVYLHPIWSIWQWTKKVIRAYGYTGWPVGRKDPKVRKHDTVDKDGYRYEQRS